MITSRWNYDTHVHKNYVFIEFANRVISSYCYYARGNKKKKKK